MPILWCFLFLGHRVPQKSALKLRCSTNPRAQESWLKIIVQDASALCLNPCLPLRLQRGDEDSECLQPVPELKSWSSRHGRAKPIPLRAGDSPFNYRVWGEATLPDTQFFFLIITLCQCKFSVNLSTWEENKVDFTVPFFLRIFLKSLLNVSFITDFKVLFPSGKLEVFRFSYHPH